MRKLCLPTCSNKAQTTTGHSTSDAGTAASGQHGAHHDYDEENFEEIHDTGATHEAYSVCDDINLIIQDQCGSQTSLQLLSSIACDAQISERINTVLTALDKSTIASLNQALDYLIPFPEDPEFATFLRSLSSDIQTKINNQKSYYSKMIIMQDAVKQLCEDAKKQLVETLLLSQTLLGKVMHDMRLRNIQSHKDIIGKYTFLRFVKLGLYKNQIKHAKRIKGRNPHALT